MASSERAITDVFPTRKKRTAGKARQKPTTTVNNNSKAEAQSNQCGKSSEKLNVSASKKAPSESIQPLPAQQPFKTPTRHQSQALGRLRKTPRRIAEWGHELENDSGPEITWDNNSPSPTKTLQSRSRGAAAKKAPDDISALIKKLSKGKKCPPINHKASLLFDVWMDRDDVVTCTTSKTSCQPGVKKKSVVDKTRNEHTRPFQRKRFHNTTSTGMKFHQELSKFIQNINETYSAAEPEKDSSMNDEVQKEEITEHSSTEEYDMDIDGEDFFNDDVDDLVQSFDENLQNDQRAGTSYGGANGVTRTVEGSHDKEEVCKVIDRAIKESRTHTRADKIGIEIVKIGHEIVENRLASATERIHSARCRNENGLTSSKGFHRGEENPRKTGCRKVLDGGRSGNSDNRIVTRAHASICNKISGEMAKKLTNVEQKFIKSSPTTVSNNMNNFASKNGTDAFDAAAGRIEPDTNVIIGNNKALASALLSNNQNNLKNAANRSIDEDFDLEDLGDDDIIGQLDDDDDDVISFRIDGIPELATDNVERHVKTNGAANIIGAMNNPCKEAASIKIGAIDNPCEKAAKNEEGGDYLSDFDGVDLEFISDNEGLYIKPKPEARPSTETNMRQAIDKAQPSNDKKTLTQSYSADNDLKLISDDLLISDDFDLIDVDEVDTANTQQAIDDDLIDQPCDIVDDFPEDSFGLDDVTDLPLVNAGSMDNAVNLVKAPASDQLKCFVEKSNTGGVQGKEIGCHLNHMEKPKPLSGPTCGYPDGLTLNMRKPSGLPAVTCAPNARNLNAGKPFMKATGVLRNRNIPSSGTNSTSSNQVISKPMISICDTAARNAATKVSVTPDTWSGGAGMPINSTHSKPVGSSANHTEAKTFNFRNTRNSLRDTAKAVSGTNHETGKTMLMTDANLPGTGCEQQKQADAANFAAKRKNSSRPETSCNKIAGSMEDLLDLSVIPKDDCNLGCLDATSGNQLIGDLDTHQPENAASRPITSTQRYSNKDIERKKEEAQKKLQQNLIKQKQQRAAALLQKTRMRASSRVGQS